MTLSVKHSIIIPSTQGLNAKADTSKITDVKLYVAKALSEQCGGCTVVEAEGYYVADNGELVVENTCEMYTIGEAGKLTEDCTLMQELADWVKVQLDQECVLIYSQPCDMELR